MIVQDHLVIMEKHPASYQAIGTAIEQYAPHLVSLLEARCCQHVENCHVNGDCEAGYRVKDELASHLPIDNASVKEVRDAVEQATNAPLLKNRSHLAPQGHRVRLDPDLCLSPTRLHFHAYRCVSSYLLPGYTDRHCVLVSTMPSLDSIGVLLSQRHQMKMKLVCRHSVPITQRELPLRSAPLVMPGVHGN